MGKLGRLEGEPVAKPVRRSPTSAGILFTMLAAAGLKASWVYKKVQVLAIFDDLDTILLMIPLQIMMIGLRWQLGGIILVVVLLLIRAGRKWDIIMYVKTGKPSCFMPS